MNFNEAIALCLKLGARSAELERSGPAQLRLTVDARAAVAAQIAVELRQWLPVYVCLEVVRKEQAMAIQHAGTNVYADPVKKPTGYVDKFGTEMRDGDTFGDKDGARVVFDVRARRTANAAWFRCYAVVLSRADGTPVYRYADGQDVRLRDEYINESGLNCTHMYTPKTDVDWKHCTLVRRVDSETPFLDRLRGPSLGKDRNGNDVRKGDSIQGIGKAPMVVKGASEFEGRKMFMSEERAPCFWEFADSCDVLVAVQVPPGTKELQDAFQKTVDRCGDSAFALEAFAKWSVLPTLADRFAAFQSRIRKVLEPFPRVTFRFDCDMVKGPSVKLWCDALPLVEPVVYVESPQDAKNVERHLEGLAKALGFTALAVKR